MAVAKQPLADEIPQDEPLFEGLDLTSLFEAGGGGSAPPEAAPSTYASVGEYRAPATLAQLQEEMASRSAAARSPGGITVNSQRPDLDAPVAARIDDVDRQLREAFGRTNIPYDPGALEGIIRNTTYSDPAHRMSVDQALAQALAYINARATNVPIHVGNEPSHDPTGPTGPTGPNGPLGFPPGRTGVDRLDPGGLEAFIRQLRDLVGTTSAQNQQFAQAAEGNLADPVAPTITVAGEDLSPGIDDALLDLLAGESADPLAPLVEQGLARFTTRTPPTDTPELSTFIRGLLDRVTNAAPETTPLDAPIVDTITRLLNPEANERRRTERLGAISDKMAQMQGQLLDSSRATLADRGLISLPGVPQGEETGAVRRIAESLGREFSPAFGEALTREDELADQMLQSALATGAGFASEWASRGRAHNEQLLTAANIAAGFSRDQAEAHARDDATTLEALSIATGYSRDRAAQLLAAVTAAGNRQQMLGDLALRSLEQNRLWNQFSAQFNLDREKLVNEIRSGQIEALMATIQQFMGLIAQSRGGFI